MATTLAWPIAESSRRGRRRAKVPAQRREGPRTRRRSRSTTRTDGSSSRRKPPAPWTSTSSTTTPRLARLLQRFTVACSTPPRASEGQEQRQLGHHLVIHVDPAVDALVASDVLEPRQHLAEAIPLRRYGTDQIGAGAGGPLFDASGAVLRRRFSVRRRRRSHRAPVADAPTTSMMPAPHTWRAACHAAGIEWFSIWDTKLSSLNGMVTWESRGSGHPSMKEDGKAVRVYRDGSENPFLRRSSSAVTINPNGTADRTSGLE